jgi:hypothetical protein
VLQSGNAIGGSISQDGRIVVAQNYTPGGIKAFDAETLELLSEVPAEYAPGSFSKVVGLADRPATASPTRCSTAARSGSAISPTLAADRRSAIRPACSPTTGW